MSGPGWIGHLAGNVQTEVCMAHVSHNDTRSSDGVTGPHRRSSPRARQALLGAAVLGLLTAWAADAGAQGQGPHRFQTLRQEAAGFLRTTTRQARQTFNGPGSRSALLALGAVLRRTDVDRGLLRQVVNNPHAHASPAPGVQPTIIPAVKALARLGNISGVRQVLERAAHSHKHEGGTRGALFELVAGAAVKRMGYKLDGLSFQIGKYETDGKVDNGTPHPCLVNMKSISRQHVLPRVLAKAEDQLRLRNGAAGGRPRRQRNPALLVIGQMPGVDLGRWNWKETARRTGSDLTVIRVDHDTGRGKVIFSAGKDQRPSRQIKGAGARSVKKHQSVVSGKASWRAPLRHPAGRGKTFVGPDTRWRTSPRGRRARPGK